MAAPCRRRATSVGQVAVAVALLAVVLAALAVCGAAAGRAERAIARAATFDAIWNDTEHIAVERVAGTPGAAAVAQYIVAALRALPQWTVALDEFDDETPLGRRHFCNIVATLAPRDGDDDGGGGQGEGDWLVLAAHYDSKYYAPPRRFVGATDAAASVALLLDVARAAAGQRGGRAGGRAGLRLVFFDGEEAFGAWSATDSVYGARHLAAQWHGAGELRAVGAFVLLDLLGAARPRLVPLHSHTLPHWHRLAAAEHALRAARLIDADLPTLFPDHDRAIAANIEDDHTPFQRLGLQAILHLIPVPFPTVWHTDADDLSAIDPPTLLALARVVRAFVAETMEWAAP